ncbi:Putative zinc-finger [Pseudidiomarina maritima]|uniref:Putative zinc-finger n=1 Tax=Pseudidiomarina maritima TaxID=519453 RepID=A0A1I6GCA3_9GAMM|nr:zf-HC2 domain-containing protein [Pseudidiomarina maritima]SFR39833.1 Putative zinc-finger [Pseudidiomarina maritima]
MSSLTCEQAAALISGFMDNELTQQQQQQLHLHLATCTTCRAELATLQDLREQLRQAVPKSYDSQLMTAFAADKPSRWAFTAGWTLILITIVPLLIYALFSFWTDNSVPMLVKVVSSGLGVGFLLLLGAVARQRWVAAKNDRYKKVQL